MAKAAVVCCLQIVDNVEQIIVFKNSNRTGSSLSLNTVVAACLNMNVYQYEGRVQQAASL